MESTVNVWQDPVTDVEVTISCDQVSSFLYVGKITCSKYPEIGVIIGDVCTSNSTAITSIQFYARTILQELIGAPLILNMGLSKGATVERPVVIQNAKSKLLMEMQKRGLKQPFGAILTTTDTKNFDSSKRFISRFVLPECVKTKSSLNFGPVTGKNSPSIKLSEESVCLKVLNLLYNF